MTRKVTADKVQLLDSQNEAHMIERRDDVSTLWELVKSVLFALMVIAVVGSFAFAVVYSFFSGVMVK